MLARAIDPTAGMDNADRLSWAGTLSFTAFGSAIHLRVNAPKVPDDVLAILPPGWVEESLPEAELQLSLRLASRQNAEQELNSLYKRNELIGQSSDRSVAVGLLEQIIQSHLASSAKDHVFVHAGVVASRNRAVIIPGRSMAGKSTLVKALLAAGATYYSDEFAVLDNQGRVHPYPRRLSIRMPNGTERPTAESLGASIGKEPLPVHLVVQFDYRAGAASPPRRLSTGKALMELASYTRPEVTQTAIGQDVLGRLAANVPVFKGIRGDADATARQLLSTLEGNP